MKYAETGFRALYHQFCVFPLADCIKRISPDFEGADKADSVLVYGYIDRNAGLTLEILALTCRKNDGYVFFSPNSETNALVRIDAVENEDFEILDDSDGKLYKRFSEKIDMLSSYGAGEEVEKTRTMDFLDGSRDSQFPDDVIVYLIKDKLKPEGCWVRICGISEHEFFGVLLNEPYQDFGFHEGDRIPFYVQEQDDGNIICISEAE